MKYDSQNFKNVCIVLKAAQQELEYPTNYVERIIALHRSAKILKMLTAFKNLGEEIEHTLSVSGNINHQQISSYVAAMNVQLKHQIQNMESVYQH
jgi:hypothetical protein